ncbi:uncharacterized protein LOC105637876 isoform X1 [Jatropha curcas]|uniref:uncharacterized protein LOC105637876 isoform X1 n=1 Tax=Jatropha curcas TaxID=180498 RepID=UPI0005FBCE8C|nr:uncharacterized protein LOC105637876 isoform X1 [Jatropha curcas]
MASFPEIADLFSKLALHLGNPTHSSPIGNREEEYSYSIDISISKLNQSLNLADNAGVRVLDTALSLMCFKAPQVFDSEIQYLVNTIVGVLSSSISCTLLRFEKGEVLRIGSSISQRDCVKFIEVVNDVISKLDEQGIPSCLLLRAAARVMVSASNYRCLVPSVHILDINSIDRRSIAVSNFLCHLHKEFSFNNHEIPLRLLSWYLDPLTLKHDISNILQEALKRPFLSLSKGFYDRMDWRSIIMCLVLSPIMFIHTRALLHNWFMLTGLGSVLELLIELVSVILDVISRPTWWGISMELGSRLPFSNAYFPYNNHWLRTLAGPLSSSGFLQLVQGTSKSVSLGGEQFGLNSKPSAVKIASIDSKSIWALVICFPDWFHFASVLLFSNNSFQKSFQLKCMLGVTEFGQTSGMELPAAAARGTADYRKKLKKPTCYDVEEDLSLGNKCDCQVIELWLREFQSIMKYGDESIHNSSSCEEKSHTSILRKDMLFRKIPLGILIGYSTYVKEDGFELLLHYAATGRILHSITKNARRKHVDQNSGVEDFVIGCNEFNRKEAISGACLVFSLTNTVERMSALLFDNEKSGLDIFCQVKLRASRYLIKCINRLIQPDMVEDENVMLVDLHDRLEQWRHQGQEMLKLDKDVDDAIKGLSNNLLSL